MSTSSTPIFLARSAPEPPAGAVVLTDGPTGTAFQRLFSTTRWHSSTGSTPPLSWEQLQAKTDRRGALPLLLVHEPVEEIVAVRAGDLHEAAELLRSTGAPARITPSMTQAEVSGLLITLRAYAQDRALQK